MYEFRDLKRYTGQDGGQLPAEAIAINGVYLDKAVSGFTTLSVSGRELLPREITTHKVGNADGEVFMDTTHPTREIDVKFKLESNTPGDFRKQFYLLEQLIDQPEAELSFNDDNSVYFIGTHIQTDDIPEGRLNVTGTMTFQCSDPKAYSETEKTATNNGMAKTISFTNNGTDSTPVKVTTEMTSQNGFLGLTLNGRYYQIGNPTEVDGVQLPPSEMIVPDGASIFGEGRINDKKCNPLPVLMGNLSQTGTVSKTTNGIEVTDYGTSSIKSWAGPSITWTFPATKDGKIGARSFFLWQNADFETWQTPEAGFQVHTVHDKDGKRLFSVILMDQSGTVNQSKIIAFVNDKKVYEANNNWTGVGYRGFMSMTKAGDNFVLVYGNTTKTFIDTALADSEGYFYTVGFGKWYNNPAPQNNWLMQWTLREDKIDSWIDIPNFFNVGDKVVLDSKSNKLTINEVPNWDRVDIGSKPLIAGVGKNELGIVVSDFATMPKVTVEYRERWL
ncbi:phage tail family protein [Latilactobacillus curvatus]|uniref:distal tail protein Dit n=1 Tax=Latilactobacillus curvatus TaxID=28038 RepID=UPI002030FB6F|nr:distal tail protein Dit [Latilactobacillus curvatus]MCM0724305.1 phage tail family protein [Latilactobacillus curvatus]